MSQHRGFRCHRCRPGKLDLAELAASAIAQVAGADGAGLESHPANPISCAQAFSTSSSVANCLLSTWRQQTPEHSPVQVGELSLIHLGKADALGLLAHAAIRQHRHGVITGLDGEPMVASPQNDFSSLGPWRSIRLLASWSINSSSSLVQHVASAELGEVANEPGQDPLLGWRYHASWLPVIEKSG